MCGLTGYWKVNGHSTEAAKVVVGAMARQIAHRGPDDQGVWTDTDSGIALAHRRLSILDLSLHGHQPMLSQCGRYVIAFNGEVYNFAALRHELELEGLAPAWRGHSDTEVMLAAIAAWGLEASLKKFVGMFAFALWDRETRTLSLARDRLGEKPLYYGWQGETFLFGSELKALKAHPEFCAEIDRDALTLFLRHNAIPAPYSIFRGIRKLSPGTFLQLHTGQRDTRPQAYWSAKSVAEVGQRNLFRGSDTEAVTELERLLSQAVSGQIVADVPLGAFLSGGIDSTTVVALMQAQSARPVKTFTIGFNEAGYNEADHAHAVARHLGTEHTTLYVTPQDAMDMIPSLSVIYDEPFADSSQIPTCLVSRLARQHVTVSLSGDGGDELFGGYNRYFWARNLWSKLGWMPRPLRAALAGVLTTVPPASWNTAFQKLGQWLPARLRYANPGDKLHKVAEILAVHSPEEIYFGLVSHWKNPEQLVPSGCEPPTLLTDPACRADLPDFEHRMMYLDTVTYLPDDILTKVDRAAMSVSLETRVPLLDHRIVEFAWTLPLAMKIRHGQGKWLLRQVLYRHLPQAIMDRPKMGFGVPIDQWLRGPLKPWAEMLISPERLLREGMFDPEPIQRKWIEHQSGCRNWSYYLWDVLMYQAWIEMQ
ncbi:MAG: asparagine synthase (glutamine-hydrolyzing) [Betaproteobacteria bacterium]|nr:asparagine synthase (glutamine-hydrolyzing) [Betaproteobacteria bacterium]